MEGLILVVTPLIALMTDQLGKLPPSCLESPSTLSKISKLRVKSSKLSARKK